MTPIRGVLRADTRTKDLCKRLRPGDIALIRHADLDSTAARSLIECRVAAVVNADASISGRYPNRGPSVLVGSGIPILDEVGHEFFDAAALREGSIAEICGARVSVKDGPSSEGVPLTPQTIAERTEKARGNLSRELDAFARNTIGFLSEEKSLLLDPVDVPASRKPISGKHALIVVRGEGYKDDLRMIEPYLREVRPVIIAVDGGADALLQMGLKPDVIIGDMDSVTDSALRSGAQLVVHGYATAGRETPGLARLQKLGLEAQTFHMPGTSEDIAMLFADENGASVIVAVGTHFSLEEFLDKGRAGMASTFLVRLRIGRKLVDAKGIGRLWQQRSRPATREIALLIAAALFPLAVIAAQSPFIRTVINTLRLSLQSHLVVEGR